MGFIAGVVLAAAIIILRALADTTIYLPEDIENVTAATILGQIPEIVVSEGKQEFWELTNGGVVHYED